MEKIFDPKDERWIEAFIHRYEKGYWPAWAHEELEKGGYRPGEYDYTHCVYIICWSTIQTDFPHLWEAHIKRVPKK